MMRERREREREREKEGNGEEEEGGGRKMGRLLGREGKSKMRRMEA